MRAKEFITEITEVPMSEFVLKSHTKIFHSMTSNEEIGKIKEFSLRRRDTSSSIIYSLFDNDQPVSYLNIDKKDTNEMEYNSII